MVDRSVVAGFLQLPRRRIVADRVGTDDDSIVVRDIDGGAVTGAPLDRAYDVLENAIDGGGTSVGQAVDLSRRARSERERRLLRYVLASEIEHEFAADARSLAVGAIEEGNEYRGGDEIVPNGFRQLLTPLLGGYEVRTATPVAAITSVPTG